MKVIYDGSEERVDLSKFPELDKDDSNSDVYKGLRKLVDNLDEGNFCIVREKKINGIFRSYTSRLFQIGGQGVVTIDNEKGTALGIKVETQSNQSSGVREHLVLEDGYGRKFTQSGEVLIETEGISNIHFYNEGTFSNSGGARIQHPIGSYVDSIIIGQKRIATDFPEHMREFDLRKRSIPFILPSQYMSPIFEGIRFGDLIDVSCEEATKLFTEQGYLEDPKNIDLSMDNPHTLGTPQHKRFWTNHTKLVKKSKELRRQRADLSKLLRSRVGNAMVRNRVLNAFENTLDGNFRIHETDGGEFHVADINPPYGRDHNGDFHKMPKRKFTIIPSNLMPQQIYAFPNDGRSAIYLLNTLSRFNRQYPDTKHVPDHRENYHPISLII